MPFSNRFHKSCFVIFLVLLVNYALLTKKFQHFWYDENAEFLASNNRCFVPKWNRVETNYVSNSLMSYFSKWLWMKLDLSNESNQNYTGLSLVGAYVYPEHISISISAQYLVKQRLYCRYFDCKRQEIPGSAWQGTVFPESVMHCPRRIGADFVSVSRNIDDEPATPMRLTFRVFEKPPHAFSVCVAPLYGNESKWQLITEFIEHHKLEGATFFYFHVGSISDYDRRMLDDYERSGEIEVKVLPEKYERPFYAWQLVEIQDCHLRSKFHSKWTAFIDIDERISTVGKRFVDLLDTVDNGGVAEIQLQIISFVKDGDAPREYLNEEQTRNELIFDKYIRAADPTWNATKAVIRSDKVGIMSVHNTVAKESGFETLRVFSDHAAVRHYRATQHRVDGSNWDKIPQADGSLLKFTERPLDPEFRTNLTKNVLARVRNVYEKIPVNCSTIPQYMWESRKFPDPCQKMLLTW